MGKKTKIDWCDSTWNPVTGCLHNCDYCYARNIAVRFAGFHFSSDYEMCFSLMKSIWSFLVAVMERRGGFI